MLLYMNFLFLNKLSIIISFVCVFSITTAFSQNNISAPLSFNYLYIRASSFDSLDKDKYVFQHYVSNSYLLTMHGWEANGVWGRKFDSMPKVKFMVWKSSKESVVNNYFGDFILAKHDLKRVKKKLTDSTKYVVFEPDVSEGFLKYKILLTNDELFLQERQAFAEPVLRDIKLSANPSPPKNFY